MSEENLTEEQKLKEKLTAENTDPDVEKFTSQSKALKKVLVMEMELSKKCKEVEDLRAKCGKLRDQIRKGF